MADRGRAGVVGVGETVFRTRRPDENYAELAQAAAMDALAMAGMEPHDVDAVVFSMAPTEFVGITDVEKWAIDAVGGRNKPFMRIHTGGATGGSAAQVGYLHVASRLHDVVLVVGADKVSETPDAQSILNLIWDPFVERSFGLNTVTMAALQAVRHMHRYGTTEEQLASAAVRDWSNAMRNPNAHLKGSLTREDVLASPYLSWPLKRYDCCPRSTGAAAIIIASERVIREREVKAAWINGVGAQANTVWIGDRLGGKAQTDYGDWDELRAASSLAYQQAQITDPAHQVDVAEIYAPFTISEIMGVEALDLCPPGSGGRLVAEGFFDVGAQVAVNPSGGTLCSNPIGVTGLVRICDAALQVLGRAGGYQIPNVGTAVATAVGGSFQFHTCMVLGAEAI